jgi:prepilin-type N-terminal cleavage/methylation domain-containing protein
MIVPRSSHPRAFTLIELMLSIALVVVLLFGVEQLFQTTTDAIQAGQTVGQFSSDTESASPALFDDLNHVVKDGPCFIIASQIAIEFLNKADAQTGTDPTAIVADTSGNTYAVNPALYGQRSHRVDLLSFFVHSQLRRKTANDGSLTSFEVGDDAFIQISHLALPAGGTGWVGPQYVPPSVGDPTLNRLAPYASHWVLGRSQVLLRDPNTIPASDVYLSQSKGGTGVYAVDLRPLSRYSQDSNGGTGPHFSRYDVAGITLEQFRQKVTTAVQQQPNLWWVPMVTYEEPTYTGTPGTINYTGGSNSPYPDFNRFQGDPRLDAPLDAASVANLSPYFLQHCSQFIVEYAGDYLSQDPLSGNTTGLAPDGTVDFTYDINGNRQILWYGLPRMTHIITTTIPAGITLKNDVVPLRDYYYSYEDAKGFARTNPSFEYCINLPYTSNYANIGAGFANANYVAAWRNNCPSMIRILFKLDDPNNKVQDGPWYEYVFRLK